MASPARRTALALVASLAVHLALAFAMTGVSLLRALSLRTPIEFELRAPKEAPAELPLGPPPEPAPAPRPRPRKPAVVPPRGDGPGNPDAAAPGEDAGAPEDALVPDDAGEVPDAEATPGAGQPAPELAALGPPGARLSAVLRLDRLREPGSAAYGPLVERILRLLPDRRRLLDGSDLQPLRDFDSLLVATPNPMDDAVTFLAVTHRLSDAAMQAELSRAAEAAGQAIEWKEVRGRPVGLRARRGRDDRMIVLPDAGLVVVATPAYADLLLGEEAAGGPPGGGAPARSDAGARGPTDWQTLARRLSAESDLVPEGVVFLLDAANLFSTRRAQALAEGDELAAPAAGLPMPARLRLQVTAAVLVEAEARGSFTDEAAAVRWAQELPALRRKLLGNPLTMLSGLGPVVSALQVEQDGAQVTVRTRATRAQVEALFALVLSLIGAPP